MSNVTNYMYSDSISDQVGIAVPAVNDVINQ